MMKKTESEKQLIKFRNQLRTLLIRNPGVHLVADENGNVLATIPDGSPAWSWIYLPTSGPQEPIRELTANGVPVSL
jgi:hypothetical protein